MLDQELEFIPSIGQTVHFYPTKDKRVCAIVVETHPAVRDEERGEIPRPFANLQILHPDGEIEFKEKVPPISPFYPQDIIEIGEDDLEGKWTFPNEVPVFCDKEDEELFGSQANFHVGADI